MRQPPRHGHTTIDQDLAVTALAAGPTATASAASWNDGTDHLGFPAPLARDPFDRMLLTGDGTVTTLLEACTGEPVATRTTRQAGPAPFDLLLAATGAWWHPDAGLLELGSAERVIARRAILTGARSGVAYVLAESLVVPGRLPGAGAERLMRAGASLGRLLLADALETRRELLQIVAVRAGAASDALGVASSATLARRTYRIVIRGRAAAAVTEWLPPGRLAATARAFSAGRGSACA